MKIFFRLVGVVAMLLLFTGQGCISLGGDKNARTGQAGIFASTNKGSTWQSISLLPTAEGVQQLNDVSVYRMFNDPQFPSTFYWGSRNSGLFYTYNDGRSWQHSPAPLDTGFIYGVAVHPDDECVIYASNGFQVFKTDNCNRTWKEVHREERQDAKINSLAINQFFPYQVYMIKENGEILRSVDGGSGWSVLTRIKRADLLEIMASPHQEGLLYVADKQDGLYRSTDTGDSWQLLEQGFKEYPDSREFRRFALHPNSSSTLYWISTYGILRSDDYGESWTPFELITPPGSANIYAFVVNPADSDEIYYTATIGDDSIFYSSNDRGQSWTTERLPSGQLPTYLRYHPEKDILYLGFTILPGD